MTLEAERAKDLGYKFECKKDALKQVQSGDVKVTFTIQPDDMPSSLYSDVMGQRYVAVVVPIGDDEKPQEKKKSYAQQAKMLIQDKNFEKYVMHCKGSTAQCYDGEAEQWLKFECEIKSCAEIVEGSRALTFFKELQRDFMFWRDN